ncbi:MAG TPA: hypothetical protein DCS42_00940 [Nitrospiraceae bacterium]|nr:hypothetical protein [Nitrospiraceae bacterium]
MAINYITVDRSKQMGADLLSIIEGLRSLQDRLRQHKEMMDNMTDAIDWTKIEAQYGIPVGKGDDAYNLVAGTVTELAADVNFSQLVDWFVPVV